MPYKKEQLLEELQRMGINSEDTLFVHSSMKAIGAVDGGADTVLDVLSGYLCNGLLVLPTHTWETITPRNNFYNYQREPACTGILPNLFLKRPGVVRSLHPTHSVAALGTDAEAFVDGEEFLSTSCGRTGCMGKLLDRNGKVLFLGCNVARNTFLHGVEEWNEIPDRMTDELTPYRILLRGREERPQIRVQYYHTLHSDLAQNGDVSVHYGKIMPIFLREGAAKTGVFGLADCTVAECRGMYEITSEYLKRNPMLFNDFTPIE